MKIMLGSCSFDELTMTTRCSGAEVMFLRLEANYANSAIKPSVITQSTNARVFSEGVGSGDTVERGRLLALLMTSTSRDGNDDRWSCVVAGNA